MTLIADVFRKLQTTKDDVRQMSKKSRLRRLFNKRNWGTVRNIIEVCLTAPLFCLLVTVKTIELEEVCLSNMENLRTVC